MANIRKRGNSYQIRVSCGYDVNKNQKFQSISWKPEPHMTEKQIEKELNRQVILFEEKCKKGQVTASVKFETLAEEWLDQHAKISLKNTTYIRMKQLRTRIYPAIGHMKLDKITARILQDFVTDMSINGTSFKTGKPISSKTVTHHLSFISDVFNYAIRMDMLMDNPCRRVFIPKSKPKEKEFYTIEEVKKLFDLLKVEPLKYQLFFNLAIYSGFRRGELLGLEWKDIEWDSGVISIHRTSNYTAERGTYTDTTKTKKSMRSLKFPEFIIDMLRKFKVEQDIEIERLGTKWEDNDRLFTKWNGEPMNNGTPYFWFNEFCERNNFRDSVTFIAFDI